MTDPSDRRSPHRIGADGARRVAVAFARAVVQTGPGESDEHGGGGFRLVVHRE